MDIYQDIVYKLHIENNSDRKQFMYKRLFVMLYQILSILAMSREISENPSRTAAKRVPT